MTKSLVESSAQIFRDVFNDVVTITNIEEITKGNTEIENYDLCVHVQDTTIKDMPVELGKIIEQCTLKPYDYQIDTVKMIRQIELEGKIGDLHTNAVLVKLPIGSGKSLVYELLSLAFPSVPLNPIITSVNGVTIEFDNQLAITKYPFFYEKPAYSDDLPVVIGLPNYSQRNTTLILTHSHLLDQTTNYFYHDFPSIKRNDDFATKFYREFGIVMDNVNKNPRDRRNRSQVMQAMLTKYRLKVPPRKLISVNSSVDGLDPNSEIWIVIASTDNVSKLRLMSQQRPFKRVIIDDFTSMLGLNEFRQIYASSTIFISGSGWNRDKGNIPISYYSLQGFNDNGITLVDDPERTLKGIKRDSILSLSMKTADNSFNEYNFISDLEGDVKNMFNLSPDSIYGPVKNNHKLGDYLGLRFLLNFSQSIGNVMNRIDEDITSGALDTSKVPYTAELIKQLKNDSRILWDRLVTDGRIAAVTSPRPIMNDASCVICKKTPESHHSFGIVMKCCGAFICSSCLAKGLATTNKIQFNDRTIEVKSHYCACCQSEHPRMIMSTTRDPSEARKCITPILIDNCKPIHSTLNIEYIAYGILHGFEPVNHLGRIITEVDRDGKPLFMQSRAQIGMFALATACRAFAENGIKTSLDSNILIYGAPRELVPRISGFYENKIKRTIFKSNQAPALMFKTGVNDLIGLHSNIPIIIKWAPVINVDELHQLIGRIVRLSNFDNRLYIYADLAPDNSNASCVVQGES